MPRSVDPREFVKADFRRKRIRAYLWFLLAIALGIITAIDGHVLMEKGAWLTLDAYDFVHVFLFV